MQKKRKKVKQINYWTLFSLSVERFKKDISVCQYLKTQITEIQIATQIYIILFAFRIYIRFLLVFKYYT